MRRSLLAVVAVVLFTGCFKKLTTPVDDIPKLKSLDDVMDNQATTADPQFAKIGQAKFSDDDFAAFAAMSTRLLATSTKIKDFSKGPEFNAFADRLNAGAKTLGTAAAAKDGPGSDAALKEMKATCKACHSKFR
jgi:cytochrome c556